MSASYYRMAALTGGTDDALDSIAGDGLSDGDRAVCFTAAGDYYYELDADNAGVADGVNIIEPDTNAGDKRWVLKQFTPATLLGLVAMTATGFELGTSTVGAVENLRLTKTGTGEWTWYIIDAAGTPVPQAVWKA